MAYEFKTLGSVEALTEVPENAHALVEVDGAIKRVPGGALGNKKDDNDPKDNWDIIIYYDSGNYLWEKGNPNELKELLFAGAYPRVFIYTPYDGYGVSAMVPTSFDYYAASGHWFYMLTPDGTRFDIDDDSGEITVRYPEEPK